MSQQQTRGSWGRVLAVDLERRTTEIEEVAQDVQHRFLGGLGLAAQRLFRDIPAGVDPWGPDNVLGFTPGLLTDTGSLFTGRWMVTGKSPATGGWNDSNCGGDFAPALKRSKVDGVFVRGVSEQPLILRLDEEGAELLDASEYWGLDTVQTEAALHERFGKRSKVATVGPAGERRSSLAGVVNDGGRIAARGGLGGVMGAKGLKAIVAMGKTRVPVADKQAMRAITKAFKERIPTDSRLDRVLGDRALGMVGFIYRVSPVLTRQPAALWRQLLSRFGTPALTVMGAQGGDSPVKNWLGTGVDDFPLSRVQRIGADAVIAREIKKYGCYSCPLRCGGIVRVEGGPWPIEEMHKPEYETLCAFGTLCLVDDLDALFKVNDLCNRGGIDTISAGAVVAFAFECFERGLITTADTDGLELRWGDARAMVELTRRVIEREGIGDVLARGVRDAAEEIGGGAGSAAVHFGGMEAPMHDPRYDPGFAASYVCDPTPGRHTTVSFQYLELQSLDKQFSRAKRPRAVVTKGSRNDPRGKGDELAVGSYYKALVDATGACLFGTQVGGGLPLVDWANAATGWERSADDYLVAGERIHQLRHAFNLREGIHALQDARAPGRTVGSPPQTSGPFGGLTLDAQGFVREYYGAMGWSLDDSRPDLQRLAALDLPEVVEALS